MEEHRRLGADLDVDVPFQYLTFFLDDDEKLEDIRVKYSKGEMLTSEVKAVLTETIQKFLKEFQDRRAKVTDADVEKFMSVRKIVPYPKKWAEEMERREKEAEEKRLKEEEEKKAKAEAEAERVKAKKAAAEAKKAAAREFAKKKEEEAKAKKEAEEANK